MEIQKKIVQKFSNFEIITFELVTLKNRFYREEYFSLRVNMLTNSLKISDSTKTECFELIFFKSDQKIRKNTAVHI